MPERPEPGLVVLYDYLWGEEAAAGRLNGRKLRPACIVLVTTDQAGGHLVRYAPITHLRPRAKDDALEVPADEKRRLGLDDQPSWVIVSELNREVWPAGLGRIPGRNGEFVFGRVSDNFLRRLLSMIVAKRPPPVTVARE